MLNNPYIGGILFGVALSSFASLIGYATHISLGIIVAVLLTVLPFMLANGLLSDIDRRPDIIDPDLIEKWYTAGVTMILIWIYFIWNSF